MAGGYAMVYDGVDLLPARLPDRMAAWVLRPERQGEPRNALAREEVEVPESQAMRANQLMIDGTVRPVLSEVGLDAIPEVHQRMYENKLVGKVAVMVGAESAEQGRHRAGPGAIWAR